MAGYIFQLERALYWLSKGDVEIVGIETEEDVVAQLQNNKLLEQTKNSLDVQKIPYADTSKDLWNTILIWLESVKNKNCNVNQTGFLLTSNSKFRDDQFAKKINNAKDKVTAKSCAVDFRILSAKTPDGIKEIVDKVLKFTDDEIAAVFEKVETCDGTGKNVSSDLLKDVKKLCHIPDHYNAQLIVNELQGWIQNTVMNEWRNRKLAILKKNDFDKALQNAIRRQDNSRLNERAKALVQVSPTAHSDYKHRTFVLQVESVCDNDDPRIYESIEDFFRFESEVTRLSVEADLADPDITSFKDRLEERWKGIFRRNVDSKSSPVEYKKIGIKILEETLDHREKIADRETTEYYFTKGAYHFLADDANLGWHPDFKNLFKKKDQNNE